LATIGRQFLDGWHDLARFKHYKTASALGDVVMKKLFVAAGLAAVLLSTVTTGAEAKRRWQFQYELLPWNDIDDGEDANVYYEEDDSDQPVIIHRRQRQTFVEDESDDGWWIEDDARNRYESRKRSANITKKLRPAPQKVAALEPKTVAKPKLKPLQKPVANATVITKTPKPVVKKVQTASLTPMKPTAKTIGCTAGAAVVTGYGFADVKPKACTGATYAYSALRAGKLYEIKLTAASGEISDVKKLN
jgi:hypothetical protein